METQAYDLQNYVQDIETLLDQRPALPVTAREVSKMTRRLVQDDTWLDAEHRVPCDDTYARYLLHRDRNNRFVVLSLIWMPGQSTPVHDHSCWGVMGILKNRLEEVAYDRLDDGTRPGFAQLREGKVTEVSTGSTSYLLPPYQEIHRIGNASEEPTISIHVYGRDLDQVNIYDLATGKVEPMRIKYYNPDCGPNFVI